MWVPVRAMRTIRLADRASHSSWEALDVDLEPRDAAVETTGTRKRMPDPLIFQTVDARWRLAAGRPSIARFTH